jgi:phage shock protein A
MSTENLTPPSVSDMLRITGNNHATFMSQVADHIDGLEKTIADLKAKIAELESTK